MVTFSLVVPFTGFIENAFDIFEEHNATDKIYNDETYRLEEIIADNRSLDKTIGNADVIIVRGLFAELIQPVKKDTPVVEIPIPATDLLRAVLACRRRYHPVRIGIIGVHNLIRGIEEIAELVDIPIIPYLLRHPDNIPVLVDQAQRDGCTAVIGGDSVCEHASANRVDSQLVQTGKESFWQSITNAKRAARISRNEQEKTGRLQAMLDLSRDGIFSFDGLSRRIQMINHGAEVILGLDQSRVGRRVEEAPFPEEFQRLILSGEECSNEVTKINNSMITVSTRLIRIRDRTVGTMVHVQEVQGIQNLERNIRRKIYSKGHVAKATFADLVTTTGGMARVIDIARQYSLTDSNILLLGESGTGKELMAQGIHNHSSRRDRPFVAVNCAAIPESLLESELFGYVHGAFTGAQKGGKPGYFELAHGGSIFLDEIGELPLAFQTRLLRVIQEREIMRLGGNHVIPVDVRIIAATNRDLERMVEENRFRQDLFFRLDVLRIAIPSLRARKEDVPALADSFIQRHFPGTRLDASALDTLAAMRWPGNVRQLQNFCERLAVLNRGRCIGAREVMEHHPDFRLDGMPAREIAAAPASAEHQAGAPVPVPASDERQRILAVLARCRFNRSRAAAELGMNRSTLWRKMKTYGL